MERRELGRVLEVQRQIEQNQSNESTNIPLEIVI